MIRHTQAKKSKPPTIALQAKKQAGNKTILQAYKQTNTPFASTSKPGEQPVQKKANNTGLPDQLKAGVENLSGYSLDDVNVHYNSSQPATLQAHAYAQGTDIHVAPGQEKHLPHEAWHVVQQKQGRVKPTTQLKGNVQVNDDTGLEKEADVMGSKALQFVSIDKTDLHTSAYTSGIIQREEDDDAPDFGKFPANEKIDPDKVGEENNGIRELEKEDQRPDDVPLNQNYRLAMHELHNVVLILEKADRSGEKQPASPNTQNLRTVMDDVQKEAKNLAKTHKASMRDLSSSKKVGTLTTKYEHGMRKLVTKLKRHTTEGRNVIKKHNYLPNGVTIKGAGTELWRTQWLNTKKAVNTAMFSLWGTWEGKLKKQAKQNKGNSQHYSTWKKQVDQENWDINYGGSLMKGYKGPPKQNTRFLASNFDVDANMDAPSIAEYLINKHQKKVDRGQLDPKGANTQVEAMDKAMDNAVKDELVTSKIVPDKNAANNIISEEFETRINAPDTFRDGANANIELRRGSEEQEVRDRVTSIRTTKPALMPKLLKALHGKNVLDGSSLKMEPLTLKEIKMINQVIDKTKK